MMPTSMLISVSDNYIRLIPTVPDWQPTHDAAAAVAYVASLFSGSVAVWPTTPDIGLSSFRLDAIGVGRG